MIDLNLSNELWINGIWLEGQGPIVESDHPVSGEIIWRGESASIGDVDAAVRAGHQVAPEWRRKKFSERQAIVEAFGQQLKEQKDTLAHQIGQETGKPLWECRSEVDAMIAKVNVSIEAYNERTGSWSSDTATGRSVVRHRPHGVVAVFGAFNFPGHLPCGHIIPALLAGNTVVFKPSEHTPATGELVIRLWERAHIPGGVINLIQGGPDTAMALSNHHMVDGLFFTGSAEVGHGLHKKFGGEPEKILALEMGGNNPLIVQGARNTDAAVHHTILSAFLSAGQRCTCARRLLVPRGKKGDEFLDRLVEVSSALKVGEYDADPQPFMGGVISVAASDRLLQAQADMKEAGGRPLLEMKRLQEGTPLLSPGIIDVTGIETRDEELFGPLLKVYRYRNFDQALEIANDTRFGLAAGILTDDHKLYERLLDEVRAGIVNWNRPLTGASSAAPFGGVGASGNHRPSAYYAADYCAWPMASQEADKLVLPEQTSPGLSFK
ncbi:MAG: succinylglutamate-semialdehyde dehydrogenase [Oleiphilaceae bacterium]|nr:succinylglutamate-semialdehyde dehydrogenase [Oleiphilaceae bacterium]